MKKIFLIITFLLLYGSVFAESVFLKNGSIIEGKILKETDKYVQIKMKSSLETKIPRKKILRTLYHDKYKRIMYIKLMSGKIIKGHIIFEGKKKYIIREKLESSKEISLSINKVDGVFRKKPSTSSNKIKNIDPNYKYHSPGAAAFSSILPFWSGSWNKGSDSWGTFFVIGKISHFSLMLYPMLKGGDYYNFYFNKVADKIAGIFILADMIYSYNVVNNYNKNNSGDVSLNIFPRIFKIENDYKYYSYKTDGINIGAEYKF
jgi:hypothetical protein